MVTLSELLLTPDYLRLQQAQVDALQRIAAALEMMYPVTIDYAGSSPDDGTIDFADDSPDPRTLDELEEAERVQSKRDRDESIAIAAGSDSF